MHLPASTALLGVFVEALHAGRYASGGRACALRDRTGRRCFAGSVQTRHWCCRLSGLLEFLRTEGLVDERRADDLTRAVGMFLPFAAAMQRWDAIRPSGEGSMRAHLRIAALELASKIQMFTHAGIDFGVHAGATEAPAWLEPTTMNKPLAKLRAAAGMPSLRAVATATGFGEHTVGRWFTKGDRPEREGLQVLSTYFAKALRRDRASLYRDLYWHYSLGDVVRRMEQWLPTTDVTEIACVCAAVARCKGREDLEQPPPSVKWIVASTLAPADFVVEHAIGHGASRDWADDFVRVQSDVVRAGIDGAQNAAAQLDFVLKRLPRRRAVPRLKRPASRSTPPSGDARAGLPTSPGPAR